MGLLRDLEVSSHRWLSNIGLLSPQIGGRTLSSVTKEKAENQDAPPLLHESLHQLVCREWRPEAWPEQSKESLKESLGRGGVA